MTGVSVAETVLKMDSGPIVRQVTRELSGDEKADDLLQELFVKGTDELLDALPAFFNEDDPIVLSPQDDAKACPADKITVEEATPNPGYYAPVLLRYCSDDADDGSRVDR